MRQLLIGIDSGTQSTKALIVDAKDGRVLGAGQQSYDLIPDLPPGAKEQHPETWRDATAAAIRQALRNAKTKKGIDFDWVFAGSRFGPDPADEKKQKNSYYLANHGDLICVVNIDTAMLDAAWRLGAWQLERRADRSWVAWPLACSVSAPRRLRSWRRLRRPGRADWTS